MTNKITREITKRLLPLSILLFIFGFFVFNPILIKAQTAAPNSYTLLAPLPCVGGEGTCNTESKQTSLEEYIPGIFNLAIGLSAAFAVLNLVYGGFQYLSTDAIQKKSEGRNRLSHSILGLVLVIGAWLILSTVNPDLLNVNIRLDPVTVNPIYGEGGTIPATPISGAQLAEDKTVRDFLESSKNIDVYADPCIGTQTRNCVNLNGLPNSAQSGLKNLAFDCPKCTITITGGTEGGHATHAPGKAIVDLRSTDQQLNNFITNSKNPVKQTKLGPEYTVKIGSQTATFLKESNPPHWHVVFQ